jgi:CheY-like chemotaxis protein
MRILAIFDCEEATASIDTLRRLKNQVEQVVSSKQACSMLAERTFDVVICQASLQEESVFDALQTIRDGGEQGDIPFVVCNVQQTKFARIIDHNVSSVTALLGGQGYIQSEVFSSPEVMQAIEKCMHSEVGKPCTVSRLPGFSS